MDKDANIGGPSAAVIFNEAMALAAALADTFIAMNGRNGLKLVPKVAAAVNCSEIAILATADNGKAWIAARS